MHSGKKQKSKAKPHGFKSSYRPSELFGIHANIHYFDNLKKLMDAHKTKTESILMRNRAVEAFNRKKFLVRDLNDKKESADILAKLMENLKLLISTLRNTNNPNDKELQKFNKTFNHFRYTTIHISVTEICWKFHKLLRRHTDDIHLER